MTNPMNPETQRCCRCKVEKPCADFGRNLSNTTGLARACRACSQESIRISRAKAKATDLEAYRARSHAYYLKLRDRDPEAFSAKTRARKAKLKAKRKTEHTANEAAQFPNGQA